MQDFHVLVVYSITAKTVFFGIFENDTMNKIWLDQSV